jgi:acyl transferase domain-containing protein
MSSRSQPMTPVAIIGMGCRFPGAENPDAFWRLLAGGVDAITEVPADRWDIEAFYDPDLATPGMMSTRWGGFLSDVDAFDARFFGVSPGEAKTMDPQQRLLLEVAWETIERAGIAPARLADSRTGVFVGIGNNDYGMNCLDRPENINAYFASGNALCMSVNRLSHFFDLKGPSLAVDSGCSSSLAALHYACQSLRLGECSLALVGGVSLVLSPQGTVGLSQSWLTAADGRCKSFDEAADGYVRSDGCGMVLLKPLPDAIADGDPILAVVRGSAVNQDGRSVTFTTPSATAQVDVMRTAFDHAGISPGDVSYVEAHGVGTAVMDAIEAQSIATLFGEGRNANDPCLVGSVKTNIGHSEWASGMASLIKVVLALQHEAIPAHLHLETLIAPLRHPGLRVPNELQAWPRRDMPRRAAVSSFGLGGTNVHAVIEEAPVMPRVTDVPRPAHLFVLSARDPQALAQLIERYGPVLDAPPGSLADICYTTRTGRAHFAHRIAIVASSLTALSEQMQRLTAGQPTDGVYIGNGGTVHTAESEPQAPAHTTAWEHVLHSLAQRYVNGADLQWDAIDADVSHARIPLPTYPFQRESYWLDGGTRGGQHAIARPFPSAPLRDELHALPAELRWDALLARVQRDAANVLGLQTPDALDVSRGFFDLGMRSLAAMEFRSLLQNAIGSAIVIPATVIFDRPTTMELARWLAGRLDVPVPESVREESPAIDSALERECEAIERLSDEEARAALLRELEATAS